MSNYTYPFAKVKRTFDTTNNCSVAQFVKALRDNFEGQLDGIRFSTVPLTNNYCLPMLLSDMSVDITITALAVKTLSVFLSASDGDVTFGRFKEWARKSNDAFVSDMVNLLISRIKGDDDTSIISVTHLAYYIADMYRIRTPGEDLLILPNPAECAVIRYMTQKLVLVMKANSGMMYRPEFVATAGASITRGTTDFMSENAVWGVKLTPSHPGKNSALYLLTCYLLARKSEQYKDAPIQFIRAVSLADGVIYSADIRSISPKMLQVIEDSLFGPRFPDPSVVTLDRSQQCRLVEAMVRILEVKYRGSLAVAEEVTKICMIYPNNPALKRWQNAVVHHFGAKWPTNKTAVVYQKGVALLNQLFYYADNPDAHDWLTVTLDEKMAMHILKKALDY